MKNLITIACLLFSIPLMAQTKVVKKNAVKANNFGITYSLPKTQLIVDAEVTKVTCKAGPYYKYAEKYLGVKDAITEDKVYYELGKLSLVNKGIPDPDNTYIVEFKSGTVAPYAYLTEDGLLCSINAEYTPEESELETIKKNGQGPAKVTDASVFSEELLMAGSTARQAEVAAKQIYRIRESRLNILTGEAEPDYERCVAISTKGAQREMVIPSLIAIIAPILTGVIFGVTGVVGLLIGGLSSGFVLAIFMANAGGAWDNAKKYVEEGNLGGKGGEVHKATVVGDTVGDPFKDTSGPSLNILIKLMSMVAIVMAGLTVAWSLF